MEISDLFDYKDMNSSITFESEALRTFLSSHTRLNNYIKVAAAALEYLQGEDDSSTLSERINSLILKSGERWTPRILVNPNEEISVVYNDLIKSGIVWVYSAFDVFFKQVEGIFSDDFQRAHQTFENQEIGTSTPNIIKLYQKLHWDNGSVSNLFPILKFYEAMRHCIAHNGGLPNQTLISIYESHDFNQAIENWQTKFSKNKLSRPPIVSAKTIDLKPHHAITYSETCRRIGLDVNKKIFEKYGIEHFIKLTIRKHIENSSGLSDPACENYLKYISFHLKKDFGIGLKDARMMYETYESDIERKGHLLKYKSLKRLLE